MSTTEDDEFLSFTSSPQKPTSPVEATEISFDQFSFTPTIPLPSSEDDDDFGGFSIQNPTLAPAPVEQEEFDDFGDFGEIEEQPQDEVDKEVQPAQKYSIFQLLDKDIEYPDDPVVQQLRQQQSEPSELIDKVLLSHRSFLASAQLFKWKDSMIRKLALQAVNVPTNIEDELTRLENAQITYNRSRSVSVPNSPSLNHLNVKTTNSSPYASRSLEDLTFAEDPFGERMEKDSIAFSTRNNEDLLGEVTLPMIDQQRLLQLCTLLPKQIISHPNVNTLVEEYVTMIRDLDIVIRHLEVGKNSLKKQIKQNNATIQQLVRQVTK